MMQLTKQSVHLEYKVDGILSLLKSVVLLQAQKGDKTSKRPGLVVKMLEMCIVDKRNAREDGIGSENSVSLSRSVDIDKLFDFVVEEPCQASPILPS